MNTLARLAGLIARRGPLPAFARRRLAEKQPGQVLIMVSVMFMVLIGFVAIATDTGFIWMNRRTLQNAADAGALAGVQALPEDTTTALSTACDYATSKNAVPSMVGNTGSCGGKADVTFSNGNTKIKVTTYKTINPVFGIALGFASVKIGASATAVVGSIATGCPFPLFQTPEMMPGGTPSNIQFYTLTAMHLAGYNNQNGNFLTVDVGSGAKAVQDAMTNNDCGTPMGLTMSTEPGNMNGPVGKGFGWRLNCATGANPPGGTPSCPSGASACPSADITPYLVQDPSGLYELSSSITRANCTRLVMIPIFPGPFSQYNGKTTVNILGFAIYYISGYCASSSCTVPGISGTLRNNEAWGYYVRMAAQSDTYIDYNGLGTKVFALVD